MCYSGCPLFFGVDGWMGMTRGAPRFTSPQTVRKKRVIEHKMHALKAQAELAAREGNTEGEAKVSIV